MKVIFILGSGHCGSTLLDLILDSHGEIVGIGELVSLDNEVAPEDLFWQKIFSQESWQPSGVHRIKKDILLNRPNFIVTNLGEPVVPEEYISYHEDLYRTILETSGKSMIVDSSKNPERVELLARSQHIEPYILHISRGWGAVFWSYYRKYPKSLWFCFWKRPLANLKVTLLRKRFSDIPYHFLSYEQFAEDPRERLADICDFIGVTYEDKMLDFRAFEHHTLGGNRMKKGTESRIIKDESWREMVSLPLRILFLISSKVESILYRNR